MRTRILTLAAALLAQAALSAEPTKASPLTADTMWKIKRLTAPAVAPDGQWAVVPVTTWDVKEDKPLTDLWLVKTDGSEKRQLTSHEGSETSPAWSPDGKWIAFEAKRGDDEAPQVYVLPVAGGEARRVTKVPTGASAPKWFPDSRRIAFVSRVWRELTSWEEQGRRQKEKRDSKLTARTFDKATARYWDRWLDEREAHVYAVPLEGGEPVAITLGTGLQLSRAEAGGTSYDVAPDGSEIAFAADTDETGVQSNFDVYVVSAGGGKARNLTPENPASDTAPVYSPDGRYVGFARQVERGFYADRVRLVVYDRQAGTNRVVTDGWDRSIGPIWWTADSKAVITAVDDAAVGRIHRVDVATGAHQPLTTTPTFSSLALSRDGRALVALRESFSEPPTLVSVAPASGEVRKLSDFNDELLAGIEWGRYESVTYAGSGGKPIQMWVVYPPGFDAARKYPVYMLLHGGPHNGVQDAFTFRWNAQVFAGWGYVTTWHNFHGSSGFGQAFADSINPDWATKPYEDTIRAAEWLAAKPWVDGQRLAAGGGSYGGYLASLVLGRPHPFKTLIAHAAVYNLYTQYGSDYGSEKRRHGEFWEPKQDALYRQMSPHFGAPNFKAPTLVVHGGLDYRVPENHGIELFNTLQNRGVRSRLVYYPNENHWILKSQNSLHWYKRVLDWLMEFIGSLGRGLGLGSG
jgi:dipeptidyl aminopeptidase/acylaminoacyl peptidase